jgi:lipopolysaccharide export system protein LptA
VQLNNTNGTWGAIVLAGKITSANPTLTQATVMIGDGVSINSTGDIANTDSRSTSVGTGSDRAALRNENTITGGTVTISGGTVSATSTARAVYHLSNGALTISGGTVSATSDSAVCVYNTVSSSIPVPTVTISGGTVSSETSSAIAVSTNGNTRVTVSGNAVVTSGSTAISASYCALTITGGTVKTTGTGNAVRLRGPATISGGTISTQGARAVEHWDTTDSITVSGNAVITSATASNTSGTIYVNYNRSITITGNSTVSNTANGRAVYFTNSGGTTTLGGDPVITGTIFNATTSGGVSISTSAATPFAPSTGKVYTIGYTSTPAVDRVAVTNGAPFAAHFALSGQASRRLVVSGADLVIGEN